MEVSPPDRNDGYSPFVDKKKAIHPIRKEQSFNPSQQVIVFRGAKGSLSVFPIYRKNLKCVKLHYSDVCQKVEWERKDPVEE